MTTISEKSVHSAIRKFMQSVQRRMASRGNTFEKVDVEYGRRWAKIVALQRNPRPGHKSAYLGRRAMYFVDLQKGPSFGYLHEAESWDRPRRWSLGPITSVVGRHHYRIQIE